MGTMHRLHSLWALRNQVVKGLIVTASVVAENNVFSFRTKIYTDKMKIVYVVAQPSAFEYIMLRDRCLRLNHLDI